MRISRYHKFLRVSAFIVALLLIFDGGYLSSVSKQLSNNTINYLANGVTSVLASVEPNEVNKYMSQLTAREHELNARETALNERTIENRNFSNVTNADYSTYILSIILFILTVLIVFNYVLDWARMRRLNYVKQTT